ncbi:hypothetical protein E2C01_069618 [Portunus trituberculatus]|uniref:Uncharacterized protein n=1 Tax=Portunus trituberculatus TaxID=210409 RepID=A0A5B7HZ17_PORTR|nr:hypothetical protein [Portunus trituberculatus]
MFSLFGLHNEAMAVMESELMRMSRLWQPDQVQSGSLNPGCSDLTPAGRCEVTGRMFSRGPRLNILLTGESSARGLFSQHRNSVTYAPLDSSPLACV